MRKSLLWETAFHSIFKNRRRSILTMFGIIIGIAAVITIVALGNGFKRDMLSQFSAGDTSGQTRYLNMKFYNYDNLDDAEISKTDKEMVAAIPGVNQVTYYKMSKTNGDAQVDFYARNVKLNIGAKRVKSTKKDLLFGRQLNSADNDSQNKVVLLDEEVAKKLYDTPENALKKGFEVSNQVFTIVGIIKNTSGEISPSNYEPLAFFPAKTYQHYLGAPKDHSTLAVTFAENANKDKVITKALKQLNLNGEARQYGEYQETDPASEIKNFGETLDNLTLFISAVAGISLFIAGVGVMNMMYISVSERTKEIGIRRALGANAKAIKLQFLFEGIVLTLTGGIIGYLLGMGIALLISNFLPFSVRPDLLTVIIAVGTSALIGVAFSYLPASAAAKKDLIDILK